MAIVVPTELLTASSGSVGARVFSRNQHGPYTRARTSPFDPGSARQLAVRAALSECITAWKTTLTEPERQGWATLSLALRTTNGLGVSRNAGGLPTYIRANVPRIQAAEVSLPRVDQAPASLTSAQFTPITRVVLNLVDNTVHPFFADSDPWATEPAAAILFYASAPQPLTRNFWAGPYRLAGSLIGGDPRLSNPATLPLPFATPAPDERVFVRFRLTRADARLSPAARLPADSVPQVAPLPLAAQFSFGPPRTVDLQFDSLLRTEPHDTANWRVRFGGFLWTVRGATSTGINVRLALFRGPVDPGPNNVSFIPPPFDLNGLLTGLPVQVFFNFPIT